MDVHTFCRNRGFIRLLDEGGRGQADEDATTTETDDNREAEEEGRAGGGFGRERRECRIPRGEVVMNIDLYKPEELLERTGLHQFRNDVY